MRKNKLIAVAAAMAADEDGESEDEEIDAIIDEVKEGLKDKENQLQVMRDDTMEWLMESRRYEDRAREILDLALQARPTWTSAWCRQCSPKISGRL